MKEHHKSKQRKKLTTLKELISQKRRKARKRRFYWSDECINHELRDILDTLGLSLALLLAIAATIRFSNNSTISLPYMQTISSCSMILRIIPLECGSTSYPGLQNMGLVWKVYHVKKWVSKIQKMS